MPGKQQGDKEVKSCRNSSRKNSVDNLLLQTKFFLIQIPHGKQATMSHIPSTAKGENVTLKLKTFQTFGMHGHFGRFAECLQMKQ